MATQQNTHEYKRAQIYYNIRTNGAEGRVSNRMRALKLAALLCLISLLLCGSDHIQKQREQMIRDIELEAIDAESYIHKSTVDKKVLDAMRIVPRHSFVPKDQEPYAYEDRPLPIGYGQTISQPYIVALMTDLLDVKPGDRILEIGTGSGYQAAILSELGSEVYTMEIIGALASQAQQRFKTLGYSRIHTRHGDGYYGWEVFAPFDAIVVTAAADHIPPPLIKQLKPGGRMVIPVGGRFSIQQLVVLEKDLNGKTTLRQLLPVAFVPLNRGQ